VPKRLPDSIEKTVQRIRREYGHYVQAKFMHGKYRLFEATSIYDPEKKKPKKVTRYLGWITEDGVMIPARHNDLKTKIFNKLEEDTEKKIKELEESLKEAEKKNYEESIRKKNTEKHERDILRALSMNARITVPELAKITGLSNTAVNYHLRNLERKYDIKYILELDIEKFGYINYIAFVKFKDKRPTYAEMKKQLEAIPYVQVAMTTKGMFDVVIFLVAKSTNEARITIYEVMEQFLTSYDLEWTVTPAFQYTFGFIPFRNQFFEILKEKVWTRTKEKPRPAHDEITDMEYKVLKAMNNNAAADFASIDREIGADNGRANYAYHQLMKRGIIKRSTISMSNTKSKSDALFIINPVNFDKWANSRKSLLLDIIKEGKQNSDVYSFGSDIMAPRGILLLTSVMENEGIEMKIDKLFKIINGVTIETLIITGVLIGAINHRLFDKLQTQQYEILIEHYKCAPETIKKEIYTQEQG
jgi:DNA-binding Lrp family transcriptional regulator/predicted transcriptional regulator